MIIDLFSSSSSKQQQVFLVFLTAVFFGPLENDECGIHLFAFLSCCFTVPSSNPDPYIVEFFCNPPPHGQQQPQKTLQQPQHKRHCLQQRTALLLLLFSAPAATRAG
jgi:hypothetical protein